MDQEETEGEELIKEFLEDKGIEVCLKEKIYNLRDDNKSFREPDFYLPDYGVYIEFLGRWNNPEDQSRYKQKMRIYYKNRIPCVYLWPNNLGSLDWILKRRIRQVLLRYKKRWHLIKYEFDNYPRTNWLIIFLIGVGLFYSKDLSLKIVLCVILFLSLYSGISDIFKRLKKLKNSKFGPYTLEDSTNESAMDRQ